MTTNDPAGQPTATSATGVMTRIFLGCLSIPLLASLVGFWHFGLDAHYADVTHMSEGTSKELTPHTAVDLTLQRDLLDHRATYTVTEADLQAFLERSFGESAADPSPVDRGDFEAEYSRRGWTWTPGMVMYSGAPGNGAVSYYYHDPRTGLTYQDSAHW